MVLDSCRTLVLAKGNATFSRDGKWSHCIMNSSLQPWPGVPTDTGYLTHSSAHLTPNRIEPEPRTTIAGLTLHHPVKTHQGGTYMRKTNTNFESIPALDRPPSQKLCGPVTRTVGMIVYCGRCGTQGSIDYSTGFCTACEEKRLTDRPGAMDPGT